MDFGQALHALRNGVGVSRRGWNGKDMWISLQEPDSFSEMTLPYLYLNYPPCDAHPNGARVPWLASQTDLLAQDWYVPEEGAKEQ